MYCSPYAPHETPEVDTKLVAEVEKCLQDTEKTINAIPPVDTDRAGFLKVMAGKGTEKITKGVSGTKLVERKRRLESFAQKTKTA